MLFPHRIMSYIFDVFQLDLPQDAISKFWDDPIAGGEPHADEDSRHRIPLGFYGDAAQLITKVKIEKLLCLFCNIPIFRPKSIRFSRFLLWSCDVSLLYKNRTLNTILRWVTWSFNCLYAGTYPTTRPGNRPLEPHEVERAGTWLTRKKLQFQVYELRGDWEFHKMIWQFRYSWKGGVNVGICFRCPAMTRTNDLDCYTGKWMMKTVHGPKRHSIQLISFAKGCHPTIFEPRFQIYIDMIFMQNALQKSNAVDLVQNDLGYLGGSCRVLSTLQIEWN